ncbi:ParB N-terminal domain-containing protein [Streptomyces sp. NPDC006655]|uniref:ParB/RepB/Spo0J family partition protein n=1 Tax=Streptomyces sp. NPDC006655 TaxID=3156898 RepID=UPI00345283A6
MSTETVEQPTATEQPTAITFRSEDVPLSQLISHPGNVREDLKITDRFRRSIRKRLRTPLLVTPMPDGNYKVIDGHRRLLVMIEDKWPTAPVVIDDDRAEDEAGQFLDMVTTAEQREGLTTREKAAALFSAAELGADAKRMAAETGWTQKDVKTAVKVGGATKTAEVAKSVDYEWTLDELSDLAEFEGEPEVLAELATAAKEGTFKWAVRRIRNEREEAAKLAKEREELMAAGITVIDSRENLPEKATPVDKLRTHDGKRIKDEEHTQCKGHAMAPGQYDNDWTAYCLNPALNDHTVYSYSASSSTTGKPDKAVLKRTIQGNKHYKAATQVRREWLKQWMTRKTFPKDAQVIMGRFAAESALRGDDLATGGITHEDGSRLLRDWLGIADASRAGTMMPDIVAQADARRLFLFPFMAVVASYEKATGHKDNRAWRTDSQGPSEYTRKRLGAYLAVLASLGHQVTPIEQAIIDGVSYDGTEHAAKVATETAQESGQDQLTDEQ